jgi:hypothetical protein
VLTLAFLSAGCRVYDIYKPDLQKVAVGERFVETHAGFDQMPTVVLLRERETIALLDEHGNEIRTTTVANIRPADAEKASMAQVWRYHENRVGWVVGTVLAIGAAAAAFLILK